METIIYPPTIDYSYLYQRPQQLFKALSYLDYKIIFCNYNPSKLTSYVKKVNENFYIYNGINPFFKNTDDLPIIWISYPPSIFDVEKYKRKLLVFDALDDTSDEFSHWRNGLDLIHKKADIIFTTSNKLYDFNKNYHKNVYMCPNGADYEYFSQASKIISEKPKDMPKDDKIVVGYFGAIATWVDWNLIYYLANTNPYINFVFIGPLFNVSKFPITLKNVYYLGKKEYQDLIYYLQYFDICIIPFKVTEMIQGCNPIKMYEYLSAGKPVISSNFREAQECPYVYTAKYKKDFNKLILSCLNENTNELKNKRMDFAKQNSWIERAKTVDSVIKSFLRKNK